MPIYWVNTQFWVHPQYPNIFYCAGSIFYISQISIRLHPFVISQSSPNCPHSLLTKAFLVLPMSSPLFTVESPQDRRYIPSSPPFCCLNDSYPCQIPMSITIKSPSNHHQIPVNSLLSFTTAPPIVHFVWS